LVPQDNQCFLAILRNLINSKVKRGSENDADELNRHWLKLQRNERKSKKANVDTKASKGRKIRYNINQKLVGFLPKADQAKWTHQQRNQLFRGVFQCQ
jgi:protein AATF/BFR2